MITDNQRRRAVAELREASTGAYRHVDSLDVIAGSVGVEINGKFGHEVENETYAALADFIDCPTCKNVTDSYDGGSFECSRCGEKWELTCGSPADNHLNYCPGCGAEVIDSDSEHREVAKRMKEYDVAKFKELAIVPFLECLGHGYMDWRGILDELADFIDPTCHLVGTTSENGLYGPTIFHHELSCGHTCDTAWPEPPAYCYECGCRVVL